VKLIPSPLPIYLRSSSFVNCNINNMLYLTYNVKPNFISQRNILLLLHLVKFKTTSVKLSLKIREGDKSNIRIDKDYYC
jgi:hypothetical protein